MKITMKVPKSAVSSQEGQLVEWHVEDGGIVEAGAPIYSMEMEKATLDVEAPFRARVRRLAEVGGTYAVGAPIAELEQAD